MRISSPAFTWILTGFSLRTRAVSRNGGDQRLRGDPRLAGLGRVDRADGGTDGQGRNDKCADQGGDGLRDTIGLQHARPPYLVFFADPSTVIRFIKQGACHLPEMAEIREFLDQPPPPKH